MSENIDCDVLANLNYHKTTEVHIMYRTQKEREENEKKLLKIFAYRSET